MHFFKKLRNYILKVVRVIAPGFVVGAADNDPSGIGTYLMAGAQYGLSLAWLMPLQLPLLFVVQEMCARIGLVTGQGLTANLKKTLYGPFVYAAIIGLVFANVITIGADISIMCSCAGLIFDNNKTLLAILIAIVILLIEVFVPYRIYSKILLFFALFSCAYVITAFMAVHNWYEVLTGIFSVQFQFTKEFVLLVAGILGTTISPYLFFWQTSQEVEEKINQGAFICSMSRLKKLMKRERYGTFTGMFASLVVGLFIIVTSFATLHSNGYKEVITVYDAALTLKPLVGEWALVVFSVGIIGTGFLAIPVLGASCAYALAELFNTTGGLSLKFREARFFYLVIVFSVLIGLGIHCIGIDVMRALLYAAVINCVVCVPILVCVLAVANNQAIMGRYANSFLVNVIGWLTVMIMALASIFTLIFGVN